MGGSFSLVVCFWQNNSFMHMRVYDHVLSESVERLKILLFLFKISITHVVCLYHRGNLLNHTLLEHGLLVKTHKI